MNWPKNFPPIPESWSPVQQTHGNPDILVTAKVTRVQRASRTQSTNACVAIRWTGGLTWEWDDGNRWHRVMTPPRVSSSIDPFGDWEWVTEAGAHYLTATV
jgi:hypothetical protein